MNINSILWSTVLKPVHDALHTASQETITWLTRAITLFSPEKEKVKEEEVPTSLHKEWYGEARLDSLPRELYSLIAPQLAPNDFYSSFLASKSLFNQRKQFFIGNDKAISQLIRSVKGDIQKLLPSPDQFENPIEQMIHCVRQYVSPTKPLFTEKEFKEICSSIKTVDLRMIYLTSESIKQIVAFFPNLETVDARCHELYGNTGQSNTVLKEIAKLNKLKTLKLSLAWGQEQGVDQLTKLTALEQLHLFDIAQNNVSKLRVFTHLRSLAISCSNDTDFEIMRHMPHLQELFLQGHVTIQGLQTIVDNAKELRVLDLTKCGGITDAILEKISQLKHLQKLILKNCNDITDTGVSHLGACSELTHLSLYDCQNPTNASLEIIGRLTSIEYLDLSGLRNITNEGIRHLTHFKSLKTLLLGYCRLLTHDVVGLLTRYTMLEVLDLSCINDLDEATFGLLENFTQLKKLLLTGCQTIPAAGVKRLSALEKLEWLDLSNSHVTDEAFRHIGQFYNLKTLIFIHCKEITRKGFAFLQTLRKLEKLCLTFCDGVDDDVVEFCSRLPNLRDLSLYACKKVTPFALKYLMRLEKLRSLSLCFIPGVTESLKNELKSKNPKLNIFHLS